MDKIPKIPLEVRALKRWSLQKNLYYLCFVLSLYYTFIYTNLPLTFLILVFYIMIPVYIYSKGSYRNYWEDAIQVLDFDKMPSLFYWQSKITATCENTDQDPKFDLKEKKYRLIIRTVYLHNHYQIKEEDRPKWDIELLNCYFRSHSLPLCVVTRLIRTLIAADSTR